MKRIKNLLLLILTGGVFLIFACGSGTEVSEKSSSSDGSSGSEKFSYKIDKQHGDSYAYYIEGVLANNTSQEFSYVQIDFICYDKDGNNLGTALDNTNNLLGNQTWKFKAMFIGSDTKSVDHCDYHETTSW